MRGIEVSAADRRARVEAGVLALEIGAAAQADGLCSMPGSAPDVGVVGYTLGGGLSWLGRRYGFACNRVNAIELVTAAGEARRVDADTDADLFWALRGGGGGYAIVTALELELTPIADIYAGALVFAAELGTDAVRAYRDWAHTVPDEVTSIVRFLRPPPLPDVPEPIRDKPLLTIDAACIGTEEEGARLIAPLRELGEPILDTFGQIPIEGLSRIHMDPEQPVPAIGDHKVIRELPDEAIDAFFGVVGPEAGSPLLLAELRHLGGALAREAPGAGALSKIDAEFAMLGIGLPMTPRARRGDRRPARSAQRDDGAVGGRGRLLQLRRAPLRRRRDPRSADLRAARRGEAALGPRRDDSRQPCDLADARLPIQLVSSAHGPRGRGRRSAGGDGAHGERSCSALGRGHRLGGPLAGRNPGARGRALARAAALRPLSGVQLQLLRDLGAAGQAGAARGDPVADRARSTPAARRIGLPRLAGEGAGAVRPRGDRASGRRPRTGRLGGRRPDERALLPGTRRLLLAALALGADRRRRHRDRNRVDAARAGAGEAPGPPPAAGSRPRPGGGAVRSRRRCSSPVSGCCRRWSRTPPSGGPGSSRRRTFPSGPTSTSRSSTDARPWSTSSPSTSTCSRSPSSPCSRPSTRRWARSRWSWRCSRWSPWWRSTVRSMRPSIGARSRRSPSTSRCSRSPSSRGRATARSGSSTATTTRSFRVAIWARSCSAGCVRARSATDASRSGFCSSSAGWRSSTTPSSASRA